MSGWKYRKVSHDKKEVQKIRQKLWLSQRWRKAKAMRDYYNLEYGTNYGSREFFKNENPLISKLVKYQVTYQINKNNLSDNKKKGDYEFFAPQETLTIYSVQGLETKNQIENKIENGVLSLFSNTGQQHYISRKLDINPKEQIIRGIEEERLTYNEIDINLLRNNDYYIKDNKQPKIKLVKKSGQHTLFSKEYNINLI